MPNMSKTVYCRADNRLYGAFNLNWSEKSTSIANNTSTISWNMWGKQEGINFIGHNRANAATAKAWINGKCVGTHELGLTDSPSSFSISGTVEVPHNADGNKTITITLEIDAGGGNYANDPWTYGGATSSQSMKLSFIARVSAVSCPALTMGTGATITIKPQSTSFTHTLSYKFGSATGSITVKSGQTSIAWTPPLSLASQIPKATSGTLNLTCTTHYGGTAIGSKSINVKVSIPSSVKPTIGSLTAAPENPASISSWGIYVQSQSKAVLKIGSPAGVYGSTITGMTIKGGGFQGNAASFTTGLLNKSGDITFTATVTDSRGRTSDAKTCKITVVPYKPPVFSKYSAVRSSADGSVNAEGTCVLADITYSFSDCSGKNKVTSSVKYRKSGGSSWTDAKTSFTSGKAFVFGNAEISAETSYEIQFNLTDAFGTVSIVEIVSTASVLMDFKAGGTGIAIGKVSEFDNAFEVNQNWKAYFHGKEIEDLIKTLSASVINTSMTSILERAYPVGSIYISIDPTNPNKLFGGTWKQISEGRFLLGVSSSYKVGTTGGEATHKLTGDEMPSHNHQLTSDSNGHSFAWGGSGKTVYADASAAAGNGNSNDINTIHGQWNRTVNVGGGKAHNNMPPYYVCYMFQRTK